MRFLFGLIVFFPLHAQPAIQLAAIPQANIPSFTDTPQPVACADLAARLQKYADNTKLHEQSLLSFLNDVSATSENWYTQLYPLEGTARTIPQGTFDVIDKGSNDIQSVTDMAAQNSVYLKNDLDQILSAIANCVKTAAPQNQQRR